MSTNSEKSKTGARVFIVLFDIFVAFWFLFFLLGITIASVGIVCFSCWLLVTCFTTALSLEVFKVAAIFGLVALFFLIVFLAVVSIMLIKLFAKAICGYFSMHRSMWNHGFTDLEVSL